MAKIIHFKDFLGGRHALCGAEATPDALTLDPERVTCEACLVLIGRTTSTGRAERAGSP